MSYLQRPRFNFAGRFEADVSTVNNDPAHYDNATFLPAFDQPNNGASNGWWNPTGSGVWRLFDCAVTRACYADGTDATAPGDDPVLAMSLVDAGDRAPAKLVDLDPQQQMVSTIFGLQLRLMNDSGDVAFTGEFEASPFTNIFFGRTPSVPNSSGASAFYQSQLLDARGRGPVWSPTPSASRFLNDLQNIAGDRPLSIRFVVDGYVADSTDPNFGTGRVVGTIGVASPGEPRHFVRGRQLFAVGANTQLNNAVAVVDGSALVLDVANSLPLASMGGPLLDIGTVSVGTSSDGTKFTKIADVPYNDPAQPAWYAQSGGIIEFALGDAQLATIAGMPATAPLPLALAVTASATVPAPPQPGINAVEAPNGEHVRADMFVFRADPGESFDVRLYTSVFGRPLDTEVSLALDSSGFSQSAAAPPAPQGPVPGIPATALAFPPHIRTRNGTATLRVQTSPPRNPRGYIDGQVYAIRPTLATLPPVFVNQPDAVSILLFDKTVVPDQPTWWDDVQPILQQYANLYPVMRKVLDLDDYASVIAHKEMLAMVFSLPEEHPNYMPVTRDLSPSKRRLLLRWLATAAEPRLGAVPPRLSAPAAKVAAPAAAPMTTLLAETEPAAASREGEDGSKVSAARLTPALRAKLPPK